MVRLDINDVHLVLVTDTGVFSRRGVDAAPVCCWKACGAAEGVMLDMGCGYGPIGLYFAAVCPYCQVHMSDINERCGIEQGKCGS